MTVLAGILDATRTRVRTLAVPSPVRLGARPSFLSSVAGRSRLSVIGEIKRRSPSRGELAEHLDAEAMARDLQRAGASAISVLTEPTAFGGSLADLERAVEAVSLPVLMKDFLVDPVQVAVAAGLGASAVLVILRITSDGLLGELLSACRDHGLDPLCECHHEQEIERAIAAGAHMIGINNRDLSSLAVDRTRAARLASLLPEDVVGVAESGYRCGADTRPLRSRIDAVLVGTALTLASSRAALIRELTT
jgi:indole-3-glycerol phosphate synthase